MHIGILSMQRVVNYGSFLQAFALKKTLESLGHQCDFLDIKPGDPIKALKRTPFFILKRIIQRVRGGHVVNKIVNYSAFRSKVGEYISKELELSATINNNQSFDVVIIGSDEVFNCCQYAPYGFSLQLLGQGINANKVITYAASFGFTTIDLLNHYSIVEEVKGALENISIFSVRDQNSMDLIKKILNKDSLIHLDPVFIFNFNKYEIQQLYQDDFILIYTYPNRINSIEEINAIKKVARLKNKKLISIGFYLPWCDDTVIVHPFEVINYFRRAAYVITDTFHGTVLSIKYNKLFATLIRQSNQQKLTFLLSQFYLQNRIIADLSKLEEVLSQTIDYEKINQKIELEVERSVEYFKRELM